MAGHPLTGLINSPFWGGEQLCKEDCPQDTELKTSQIISPNQLGKSQ
ncbi:MAG: hypothetical protein ACI8XV_001905 [Arenicella sp.]|jgi:hypothetical protein